MGKTEIFLLNAQLERRAGLTTVVMVPLTTIRDQHVRLARERKLVAHKWPSQSSPDILVCLFEAANTPLFMKRMAELHQAQKLARIVLDECHYAFAIEAGFRPAMAALANLSTIGVPLVLLTGTLPPHKVPSQLALVGLSSAVQVRAPSTRPNIRYSIQQIPIAVTRDKDDQNAVVQAKIAVAAIDAYFKRCRPPVTDFIPRTVPAEHRSGVVIFCQWTDLIDQIVRIRPNWLPIHAKIPVEVRQANLDQWGDTHGVAVASSLLGMGYHKGNVRGSVHWELPRNALDFMQESGRVARNGDVGFAVILWTRRPLKPADDTWGRGMLIDSLQSAECRRFRVGIFLDGRGTTCLTMPKGTRLCDNCEAALDQGKARALRAIAQPTTPLEQNEAVPNEVSEAFDLKATLDVLEHKCAACFVMGRGTKTHTHVGCPKAQEAYNMSLDQLSKTFIQWKRQFKIQQGRNICFKCQLPQTIDFHDRDRGGNGKCQYQDTCATVMFHATRWPKTRQAISDWQEWPDNEVDESLPSWGVGFDGEYLNLTKLFSRVCRLVMSHGV